MQSAEAKQATLMSVETLKTLCPNDESKVLIFPFSLTVFSQPCHAPITGSPS